jgi:hypothetical protein
MELPGDTRGMGDKRIIEQTQDFLEELVEQRQWASASGAPPIYALVGAQRLRGRLSQ